MGLDSLSSVTCTIEDGLARITLAAPERGNPLDGALCRDLRTLANVLPERDDVRAVLLASSGRFFSVGGDVKAMARDRAALPGIVREWTVDLHAAIGRLMRMRAPIVAAVHADVAGGSVSLVAAADIVVATETARFTAAFPMLGFCADSGSTVTLTQRMGLSRAKRFLMLSETLDAVAAERAGLVDIVTAADAVAAKAEAIAIGLAQGPTLAYGGIKQTMLRARTQAIEAQMEEEAQTLAGLARSDDAWEGLTAFVEKRKPRFQGR